MIKIIIIKNLVKKEKEFPKGAVFGSILLWTFITIVISFFFMLVAPVNFIITYLTSVIMSIGLAQLSYSIVKGRGEDFSIALKIWSSGYKELGTLLLGYLFVFIGLIIFIIPGVILTYGLGIVPFMLIDEDYESLSVIETLKKSCELMKKNKMKMFLLQLRYFLVCYVGRFIFLLIIIFFIMTFTSITPFGARGMDITAIFALGLSLLLIMPIAIVFALLITYISSKYYIALALFYKQVKEDKAIQAIEEV